ncbi:transposase [Nostocoides vanveenii]|uniref:transposase n=1 Tax=Nostocoides vanveenii TaxID=330835 RepID=UPI003CD0BEEE
MSPPPRNINPTKPEPRPARLHRNLDATLARDMRKIYTAATDQAAWAAFEELEEKWGKTYPAIGRLWRAAWEEFTPFLAYDVEIRRVLFSTNAIVILSQLQGVVDVADGLDRSPIVRAGRAYLQPSSRHGRGRFGVRCSSGGVRLAA